MRAWIARNMGPVGRAQSGLEALKVVSDVVGDIPDLAMRLKRVLVRLDEAGNVILFESWLRHEVPTNQAKTERISISFNYA